MVEAFVTIVFLGLILFLVTLSLFSLVLGYGLKKDTKLGYGLRIFGIIMTITTFATLAFFGKLLG